MEAIIREGALRLQTSEASCDVILNCQGHRLMAHKLILSIASPLLRILLKQDCTEPSVLIIPDINGNTMSLILDYIYTGNVIVYSNTIKDFLMAADLLQLHIDLDFFKRYHKYKDLKYKPEHLLSKISDKNEEVSVENKEPEKPESEPHEANGAMTNVFSRKTRRKLPSLLPITDLSPKKTLLAERRLSNYVIPSPWCQRMTTPMFSDPRTDCIAQKACHDKIEENDPNNNNFQMHPFTHNFTPLSSAPSQHLGETSPSGLEMDLTTSFTRLTSSNGHIEPHGLSLPQHVHNKKTQKTVVDSLGAPLNPKECENKCLDSCLIISGKSNCLTNNRRKNSFENTEVPFEKDQTGTGTGTGTETEDDERDQDDVPSKEKLRSREEGSCDEDSRGLNKDKPFKCEDCGKCFSQLRNYKYHRSVHQGTKEFAAECPECGKIFNDRGYLSSHMKIHRDRKEYACPHCPKRFNQRVAYNMHLRIHTGVKPHECPTCGKSFSRKMLLKQHQRVHTGERPYSCPECGKTFADRSNMSLHARLHTGVKPYACNLCSKSFTKKHHLKTHMNFHTGLKPYTCQKCGLAFSQSSNMRTHYKKCILKNSENNNNNLVGLESADSNSGTDTR